MDRVVTSDEVYKALVAAGVLPEDERVRRVVIDLQGGCFPIIHVERYGDERMIKVLQTLEGVEIRREQATA
jgi:hypothetical protein